MIALSLLLAAPCQPSISFDGRETAHRIQVQVARTPQQREQGLMFVKSMPIDQGMWFVFPGERKRQFWMKNTLIPLDIIFIDSKLKVINVIHRAQPETLTARRSKAPAQYVLELVGGQAKRRGIKPGTLMRPCGIDSP